MNAISNPAKTETARQPGGSKLSPLWSRLGAPRALTSRERFLRTCACRPVDRPPVWLMRQAGRALPEYRELKQTRTFLELAQTPELAAEVTLQPVRRFGFDAAIIFSDILVVPEAMGQPYHFRDGGGIEMDFILKDAADIRRLSVDAITDHLQYVAKAIRLTKAELGDHTALLGFAGSPWTLANFMLEGGSAKEYTRAKAMYYADPALFAQLMNKLTAAVTAFLQLQIDAGVDAIQLFDSLGGNLADNAYNGASCRWMADIVHALDKQVPVIVFAKGVHSHWRLLAATGAQVLGVDWTVSLSQLRGIVPEEVGLQGNLDPCLMATTPEIVAAEAARILREMRGSEGFIFNLGHGLPPNAKLECIASLVDTIKGAA